MQHEPHFCVRLDQEIRFQVRQRLLCGIGDVHMGSTGLFKIIKRVLLGILWSCHLHVYVAVPSKEAKFANLPDNKR